MGWRCGDGLAMKMKVKIKIEVEKGIEGGREKY